MKRICGLGFLFLLSAVTLMAAKNSKTFYLSADVRMGSIQLPRGICEVTWSKSTGSQVRLTINTEGKKAVTVPARMIAGKLERTGMITAVVDGVTYLVEIQTRDAKFVFEDGPRGPK